MKRKHYGIVAILAAVALLLGACGAAGEMPTNAPPSPTAKPPPQAFELTILHTNDVKGYLEPCG